MTLILLFSLIFAEPSINWEDPNLKMDSSDDSRLEAQIFQPETPEPPSKPPKIKDLQDEELDSKSNK